MSANKKITDILTSDAFIKSLKDTASTWAIPAIATTLGAGALGGYLESKRDYDFESKKERRARILRSAIIPTLTAGLGVTLLGGAKALSDIDTKKIMVDPKVIDQEKKQADKIQAIANLVAGASGGKLAINKFFGKVGDGKIQVDTGPKISKDPLFTRYEDISIPGKNPKFAPTAYGSAKSNSKIVKALRKILPRIKSQHGRLGTALRAATVPLSAWAGYEAADSVGDWYREP